MRTFASDHMGKLSGVRFWCSHSEKYSLEYSLKFTRIFTQIHSNIHANTGIFRKSVTVLFTNGLMSPDYLLLFSETVPGFPDVVGMLDCTCLRINRPTGPHQQFFYRSNKGYNFMNWLVVVDVAGYFVHTRCGYAGPFLMQHAYACLMELDRDNHYYCVQTTS